jgi:CubicO group peptidase (beta-lactamase class C family)
MSRLSALAIPLLLSLPAAAPRAEAQELEAYVDSVVNAAVAKKQTPAASVVVMKGGRIVISKGYGLADVENDLPATDQTVYRIGSLTKQFTSAAIMRLIEQGKLSLDDTLQKFFPTYPTNGNRITIRNLLTHTSGVANYTALPKWAPLMRLDLSVDSMISIFSHEPPTFKPGESYRYSNSGYFLLGAIIEKVTGKPYARYMNEDFLPSTGLKNTLYCEVAPLIKHRAQGYLPTATAPGGFVNAAYISMSQPYAAGSLCSTVGDLAQWTVALSSGKIVSAESYKQMTTPVTLNNGVVRNYGFGLNVGKLEDHREISHNGGINGFVSELHYFPDDSVIVVVLTNSESLTAPALEKLIARKVLDIKDKPAAK